MNGERFLRPIAIAALLVATPSAPLAAQTADDEPPGFERRYIDGTARRDGGPLLHDWPALSRLVRWSHGLESDLAEADRTISEERLQGFEARIDTLRSIGSPDALGLPADTVNAILDSLDARLASARLALDSIPVEVRPTGEEASAGPERDRTLVTGETAVRVPAGIAVGERDTLPAAEITGQDGPNFVDWMGEALRELDRLVHLVRRSGSLRERESAPEPTPTPRTARPPGEP